MLLIPLGAKIPALATLTIAAALLAFLVALEHVGYGGRRDEVRARNTLTEAEAELVAKEEA